LVTSLQFLTKNANIWKIQKLKLWSCPCKRHRYGGVTAPLIPNIDTRWKWVVSLQSRPLFPGKISPCT